MSIEYRYTGEFLKEARVLSKRYRSFKEDLSIFCKEFSDNPMLGDDLGNGIRKVRMTIASKCKGKRGGARVITFTIYVNSEASTVYLVFIYDKSVRESVSKKDVLQILHSNGLI